MHNVYLSRNFLYVIPKINDGHFWTVVLYCLYGAADRAETKLDFEATLVSHISKVKEIISFAPLELESPELAVTI